MRKALWIFAALGALLVVALGSAWRGGLVRAPWSRRYDRLVEQLRDRGSVAVLGAVPMGMPSVESTLVAADRVPGLAAALRGNDGVAAGAALQRAHLDGLLVRVDGSLRDVGAAGSVAARLASLRPVSGLSACFVDESTALYERDETVVISPEDARRLVSVARLVLSGAASPSERIFPDPLRRARSVEVGIVIRDGDAPLLWRSTRGGSVARALLDGSFAIINHWGAPLQDRYGRLRTALLTQRLSVSIFHDKGVLGARTPEFLRRAAPAPAWSVGFERLASWEYVLPALPGAAPQDPAAALQTLARERSVPAPGYLRPDVTLYRFRAVQLIEREPFGEVQVLGDP
jgi:hypothetical protein